MQLHCGAEHFSAEFGISNTFDDILTYSTYNVQCNTYILGPSFNLLFGSSELCLAGTHPSPDAIRQIYTLVNRTEHESYGRPPSLFLAVEPYYMYITGLRHFRDVKHTFNNSLNSCSHGQ